MENLCPSMEAASFEGALRGPLDPGEIDPNCDFSTTSISKSRNFLVVRSATHPRTRTSLSRQRTTPVRLGWGTMRGAASAKKPKVHYLVTLVQIQGGFT